MSRISPPTYLTADLPGVGGVIRARPDDFLVEEQPLYEPSGEGEHLFVYVEKRGMTTTEALRRLAKAFRVRRGEISYAGLKDKGAITRQHFSVRMTDSRADEAHALKDLDHHPRLKILWIERHRNKLRRGHLAGNRFVIRIRDVQPTDVIRAKPILDRLVAKGVPNYIGEQRFGYRQNNHQLGLLLLQEQYQEMVDEMLGRPRDVDQGPIRDARAAYDRGDYETALELWPRALRADRQALDALRQGRSPEQAVRAMEFLQRDFYVTALQSAIFNDVLNQRVTNGAFDRLLPGDLAWKHENRSVFAVDEETAAKENAPDGRVPALAISPSGPMWGQDMTRAAGDIDAIEVKALNDAGLTLEELARGGKLAPKGERRPMRVPLKDTEYSGGVDEHGPYIRVAFELPRGAFATTVLREIMKNDAATEEHDASEEEAR